MAKKKQQPKATRFSIQGFDVNHFRTTEQYAAMVQALFDRATLLMSQAATRGTIDPDKPFSFDDYPALKAELQKVASQLASQLTTTIEKGSRNQWLFACDKNDGFIDSIMDTSKVSKARLKKMQDRNLDALRTFQDRKVGGMNLSQRVWRYVGQYKEQLESALDVGLGEGRSAQELARDVKKNLREPDRLFRRVRDKRGNLVLSKAARAYHPGQGVYRSSVKNAQRLTRSEINMAYRESDFLRWQQLDFVVGFEIKRSNWHDEDGHEYKCKLCDRLQGRYPKTFKFKGWHPQCRCYAVPILMDEETFDENELGDLKAALRGTEYKKKQARNVVTDVPDAFKEWVEENKDTVSGWSSTPYFIQDNFVDGDITKGLKIDLPTVAPASFVPIKTIEEARSLASSIGIKRVDFGDATIDEINLALEILHDASSRMEFELDYFFLAKDLHKIPGRKSAKPMGGFFDADKGTMAIDLTTFRESQYKPIVSYQDKIVSLRGNIANLERQIAQSEARLGRSKSMDKMLKADIKALRSRISDIEIKIQSFEKLIASGNDALPLTVAATFKDIRQQVQAEIWHEIGHYVDHKTGRLKFKEGNFISEYCKDMRGEEFAEWFAYYKMNGGKGVPADLLKIFKSIEKDNSTTEPKIDPVQAQLDALMPSVEDARKVASEWGLDIQLKVLNKWVDERNIDRINATIATITSKANELVAMLSKYVKDVAEVVKAAKGYGVDINKLREFTVVSENLMAAQADKKNWRNNFAIYQNNLESLKVAIQRELKRQEDEAKKKATPPDTAMDDWHKRTQEAESITKTENDTAIEKAVGVEKGVEMTFDESNALRGNPNFAEEFLDCPQKEATHILTKADGTKVYVKKNPAYKKKYTVNCQSCVVAHELRRRGFDVQAIGKTKNSIPDILSHHTELAWLDEDGNTPTSKSVGGVYTPGDEDATAASVLANLNTATSATGRYHLKWTWGNMRSGHIITCERLANGTLRVYDPQNGKIIPDFAEYSKRFLHGSLKVLRVDNLRLNPLYAGCLKGNKAKKTKKKK